MIIYDFDEQLVFSKGIVAATCAETIKNHIPGCVSVEKASLAADKNGIDYIVKLGGGAEIRIDQKARVRGCSQFWKQGPEIALELWSVKPIPPRAGTVGWTLDDKKQTDYTVHTFDPSDSVECFFFPFQLLRWAFKKNGPQWVKTFRRATQHSISRSGEWDSECLFVPAHLILDAIMKEMKASRMMGISTATVAHAPNGRATP